MTQPHDRTPENTSRPPEYVIVMWASDQLRDRDQYTGPDLAGLGLLGEREDAVPTADREAEP